MTRLFIPMVTLLMFTAGCAKQTNNDVSVSTYHDYDEFEDNTIEWLDLLNQEGRYYAYIYSPRCGHCNDIKQDVLGYALNRNDFYFVEYSSDIPIANNIEDTIGKDDIGVVFIKGTPTLIEVENHVVINNIAGSNSILDTLTNHYSLSN